MFVKLSRLNYSIDYHEILQRQRKDIEKDIYFHDYRHRRFFIAARVKLLGAASFLYLRKLIKVGVDGNEEHVVGCNINV